MKTRLCKLGAILFIFFCALIQYSNAQTAGPFNSDVKTNLKPWTGLDFYNDPSNFQFALVSDNTGGMRPGIFEKGIEKLNLMLPEFVLSVGDLIQGYTEDTAQIKMEWEEFNQKVDKLKVPFFYLPGNHDITNLVMQKEWEDRFGRRYYSFTYKDVLFVILDSNDDDDYSLTEDQTNFAIDALNENPNVRWTFVLVHHPIWKYDTGGRFEKIESAMASRKHTVIAGHEHRYQHIERKQSNYYVLGTTGGGTALRGDRFGEFDHIVWVTMSDQGPVMANLKLDGILSHDITNAETATMARAMLDNTRFDALVLTNKGEQFENGTLYLHFTNKSDVPMHLNLSFYHHHQIDILPARRRVKLEPDTKKIVEVSLNAHQPIPYKELGFLKYYWKVAYDSEEYEDFYLDGNADLEIKASSPNFYFPQTAQFVSNLEVNFAHPFDQLQMHIKANDQDIDADLNTASLEIQESTTLNVLLTNNKNQYTQSATKVYEKVNYLKGKKMRRMKPGLSFEYFEGKWGAIPDFDKMSAIDQGETTNFLVGDLAKSKDDFGMRFSGYIEVPEDGLYYFRCRADDAGSLKIHDRVVCLDGKSDMISNEHVGPSGAIALTKGYHPVEIDFIENRGGERLRFYIKTSEQAEWKFMDLTDFFRTIDRK